jgi:hypothetical protein
MNINLHLNIYVKKMPVEIKSIIRMNLKINTKRIRINTSNEIAHFPVFKPLLLPKHYIFLLNNCAGTFRG